MNSAFVSRRGLLRTAATAGLPVTAGCYGPTPHRQDVDIEWDEESSQYVEDLVVQGSEASVLTEPIGEGFFLYLVPDEDEREPPDEGVLIDSSGDTVSGAEGYYGTSTIRLMVPMHRPGRTRDFTVILYRELQQVDKFDLTISIEDGGRDV